MTSSEKKTTSVPASRTARKPALDFFISYANEDEAWATWMAWVLEEAGYAVTLQAWDFRPGSNFVLKMQKAAGQAERTLAVLSTAYLQSGFGDAEWAAAFAQDPTGEKGLLVPVRVEKCPAPGLLRPIVHIDLAGLTEAEATRKLVAGLQPGRAKPTAKPTFPAKRKKAALKPAFPSTAVVGHPVEPREQDLPFVWDVPSRNLNFSGREDELAALERALKSGDHKALVQAVYALGGIGKTELAREYAYRHAGEYGIVWWVHAETMPTLSEDFASLGQALGVAAHAPAAEIGFAEGGQQPDLRETVAAVHSILRSRSDWLLLFDNAPGPEAIRDFLPSPVTGHVLITSRNPGWGGTATALDLASFKREESLGFLKERTRRDEPEEARQLAKALGDLPLALEQAAAYIVCTGISLGDYLALLKTNRKELWDADPAPGDYGTTVSTTWKVSIAEAEGRAPGATDLLRLLAYLAPDDIPRSLLTQDMEGIPSSLDTLFSDPVRVNAAVAALGGFSLVRASRDALSLHRLVQQVVRDDLAQPERKTWVTATVKVLSHAFRFDKNTPATWGICFRLVPHVLATAELAEAEGVSEEPLGVLLNRSGVCLRTQGQFPSARQVVERALSIAEKVYGTDHPKVATFVSNLGSVLQALGDFPGAKKAYDRALSIDEKVYGTDHPEVAADVNNLGSVLQALGDFPGAKKAIERALSIDEKVYGTDCPEVAADVNNLGSVLQDLGDFPGAKKAIERALSIAEKVYGTDHPNVATFVSNLGSVLQDLGDLPGAKKAYERALSIAEKVYGTDHPKVAICVSNLGGVLQDLGDLPGAKKAFERAERMRHHSGKGDDSSPAH